MPQNSVKTKSLLLYSAQVLLLAAFYFVSGQVSFSLAVSHAVITLVVFAAEGFALAAVILWGKRLWPGVFLGQLILALYNTLSWQAALEISAINSVEAIIGAMLFQRLGLQATFTRMRDVCGLLLLIFFVLQPFSATLGVLVLWLNNIVPTANLEVSWFSWWFGNALGQAIITPFVLAFLGDKTRIQQKLHNVIWLLFLAVPVAIISLLHTSFSNITIAFTITIPLLILIAAKGGMALVTLATVILTTTTLFVTRHQVTASLCQRDISLLLDLNAHLLAIVLTGQFVAALLAEYKQAQQVQQETSDYLQKISDNFPGLIFQFQMNPDGRTCFPYASVGIQDIYRISAEDVQENSSKILSILHPEDYKRVIQSINVSAKSLTPWHCDYRVRFNDGTVHWLSGHSVPQREENGAISWHGFIKDITDAKQLETEYQTVIQLLTTGFWCNDFSGRFLNVNKALCNMLGYSQQELLTMCITDIEVIEKPEATEAHIQKIIQSGHDSFESQYRCKDGKIIDVEVNVLYVESLGQRLFVFVSDITERRQAEQQLQKTTEQLQLVLEGGYLGFWDWNIVTGEVQRNAIWAEMLGYSYDEIQNTVKQWEDFIYMDDRKKARQSIKDVLEGHSPYHEIEYRMLHKDGAITWVLDHASIVQRDANGKPTRMSGTHTNITRLKQLEEQLRESENFFSSLAQISPVGIYRTDASGNCIYVNQRWCEIAGISRQQAQSSGWSMAIMVDDREKVCSEWTKAVCEQRKFNLEYRFQQPDGNIIWVYGQSTLISDGQGSLLGYVGTITDITERKANEEYINRLAFYDSLTQLPNRRLLIERLKHGIEQDQRTGSQMAVLMMDLDKFKAVNDTLGHAAGDELLRQVAFRIKAELREVDTIARLGGDEFVILLENISHYQHIAYISETLIDSLSQQFILYDANKIYIGASIGIAIHPQHGESAEVLMDHADAALYYAKEQGRGRFAFFSEQLTQKAHERMIAESRLRQAIEHQELQIYFQPLIDINSGRIMGAESLVCWHDPELNATMSSDFIELAEETGLIVAIDEWMLQKTCALGRQWLDQGLPHISLAVNISSYQFHRLDISTLVNKILDDNHFPAEYLTLEITEKALLDNHKHALAILNSLHHKGVDLTIDSFGTGYSSLAQLKDFPIKYLKIDQSFINEITNTTEHHAIISTIIATAHILGFKVLADGVATSEQLAFLQQQGCDSYQGNLYTKPLSELEFEALLLALQ